MSRLEINAELENTEIVFEWLGSEIEAPLNALREHLLAYVKNASRELGPEAKAPLPTLGGLIKQGPENELKQKIQLALSDAFEAQLWAGEARRTPKAVWRLTMSKMKWLFQQTRPT